MNERMIVSEQNESDARHGLFRWLVELTLPGLNRRPFMGMAPCVAFEQNNGVRISASPSLDGNALSPTGCNRWFI